MRRAVEWWEKYQIPLYLAAIAGGALVGLSAPQVAPALEHSINPVLALLLFATFLGVPLVEVGRAFRDVRFLGTALVANFVAVPAIAYGLSRFVADDRGLLLGVLLVLLTPCVDYVIVFTGLAGGARARLLAATPLLMLVQILLLPAYLFLFAGADVLAVVEIEPFLEAFLVLIVVPLAAAAVVQATARRHRVGRVVELVMAGAMVPLMMATLAVVVGSQIAAVGSQVLALARVIPLYVAFVVIAVAVGKVAGRVARLDMPATRAVMFSVTTRNSLVVLPLALALPTTLAMASLAVVTQTLVELVAMVVLVRVVPLLARVSHDAAAAGSTGAATSSADTSATG
ncbi:arsenic resistance protein [Pseudonocardia sichuanensis]